MAVKPLWTSPPQFVDANGNPYSGAFLYFYSAGSSSKLNVYTDDSGGTAASNPVTLNASGYPENSGNIFTPWGTTGQTYKIGLAAPGSADPPASFIWTADDISPINDTSVTIDQWVSGAAPTYVSATQFTLLGDQTSTYHVGRRLKTTNSGGTVYSTISASVFGAVTTITVVNDSGTLDSGLSAVSYGLLTNTNSSVPSLRAIGDFLSLSAAGTLSRLPAKADVVAHATTSDPWVAREIVLTGSGVTFTDIADAPYVGAVTWVKQNAAHIWTNGATFVVQGAVNYTAAAGDWIRIYATTVSTFEVTIFKLADSGSVAASQAEQEAGSSSTVFTSPGRQQFHPSACKAWLRQTTSGGTPSIVADYGVSSITDNGVGDFTANFDVAFSATTAYVMIGNSQLTFPNVSGIRAVYPSSYSTGSCRYVTDSGGGSAEDNQAHTAICWFGDQ